MRHRGGNPESFDDPDHLAEAIIARVGKEILLALPLGLGKANHIANALYARAAADPSIELRIFTALTLERPRGKSELERRFLRPLTERLFSGYPELSYAVALQERRLPPNVQVDEFFFQAGTRLTVAASQRNYICANYTHALGYLLARGVNVVAQLVARQARNGERRFSLSCNPAQSLVAGPGTDLDCLIPQAGRLIDRCALATTETIYEVVQDRPDNLGDLVARGRRARGCISAGASPNSA